MGEVIIYTKTGCPFCRKAMDDYKARGVAFKEVNTTENPEAKKMIKEKFGANRVPVIVEEGKLVSIGYNGGG